MNSDSNKCPVRISVIIPSRDGSRDGNVERLKNQIKSQSWAPKEIILAIGYSPNGRARNKGVEIADCDFLIFIDDDVILGHDHIFENLIRPILEHEDIGLTGISQLLPENANAFQLRCVKSLSRLTFPVQKKLVDSDMVCHLCLAISKDFFMRIGRENDELISGTDPDLRHRVRENGFRVCIVPNSWAYHPQPDSLGKFIRMNYINARNSAWVRKYHPDLEFELDAGFSEEFVGCNRLFSKITRLIKRSLAIFTGNYLVTFMAFARALGYLSFYVNELIGTKPLVKGIQDAENARVEKELVGVGEQ